LQISSFSPSTSEERSEEMVNEIWKNALFLVKEKLTGSEREVSTTKELANNWRSFKPGKRDLFS
jgi:hypothetical protein